MLLVNNILNVITNEKISVTADLFCQNQSYVKLKNFLCLINGNSSEDYYNATYGHFLELPTLLTNYEFDVVSNIDKVPVVTINDYKFDFYINISNRNGSCLLIPLYDYGIDDYCLYICPTLGDIGERYQLDSFTFNHNIRKHSYKFDYKSKLQIDELVKCINCHMNKQRGNYGYFDTEKNKYLNDKDITAFINKYSDDEDIPEFARKNIKLETDIFVDNYNGFEFDVLIKYMSRLRYDLSFVANIQLEYIYDIYAIRMWYDKNNDPNRCHLSIQGKYFNIIDVANTYYGTVNDLEKMVFNVPNVCDENIFSGTYDECFNILTDFTESLVQINDNITDPFDNITDSFNSITDPSSDGDW